SVAPSDASGTSASAGTEGNITACPALLLKQRSWRLGPTRTHAMTKVHSLGLTTLAVATFAISTAFAQRNDTIADPGRANHPAALPDQQIGRHIAVNADDLPPPRQGPIVSNRPLSLAYEGQTPRVPDGFTATLFASGLQHPRRLLVLPNGDILL